MHFRIAGGECPASADVIRSRHTAAYRTQSDQATSRVGILHVRTVLANLRSSPLLPHSVGSLLPISGFGFFRPLESYKSQIAYATYEFVAKRVVRHPMTLSQRMHWRKLASVSNGDVVSKHAAEFAANAWVVLVKQRGV